MRLCQANFTHAILSRAFAQKYEYIFLDAQPELASGAVNVLTAADSVLILTRPQFFSAKAKFRGNIDAIMTLQTIKAETRSATPDEQEILSKYVGWGGLPQVFDTHNKD